ncbi:MAG: putative archaeal cell division protein [Candidatus Alkanophagales archaeon MCA70_species_1]|nr:putative archaeal cell division protein [Candidatus Alkanophaga volatiphilum]
MGGLRKIFKRKERARGESVEDYVDLDIEEYEGLAEEDAKAYVKAVELTNLNEVPELKKEIYKGNILILDISLIKQDKITVERAIKDLKRVVADIGGDIAGLNDDKIIVTPTGIKIERRKIAK